MEKKSAWDLLYQKKTIKHKSKELIAYLDGIFMFGEKNPSKKKRPAQVELEMKERPEFTRDDWLTETQIKSYFHCKATEKQCKTPDPTGVQIEDTANLENEVSHVELASNI